MGNLAANVALTVAGLFLLGLHVPQLFHRQYEYFDVLRQVHISVFYPVLFGFWLFVTGLVGLIRSRRGQRPE